MKNFWDAKGKWAGDDSQHRQLDDKVSELRVSVRDFMSGPPDGSTDNWESFMDATDYLLGKGGGILEVPAVPNANQPYVLSQAWRPGDCPNANQRSVIIQGAPGREVTGAFIVGDIDGGLIENHYPKYTLRQVRNIRGVNYSAIGRGLYWNLAQGGIIEQCEFAASLIGIQLQSEIYNCIIRNCIIHGGGNVGIGIVTTQSSIENTSLVGWDVGLRVSNFGFGMRNMRFEVNKTACQIGIDYRCAFMGKKNGNNLEITEILDGSMLFDPAGNADTAIGCYLIGGWAIRSDHPSGMPYIASQVSGTPGGVGIYTLSNQVPMNISPQRFIAGKFSQLGAFTASDVQTERCDVGIEILATTSALVASTGVTGTVGVQREGITSITWAANVATVTVNHEHCLETGRLITFEGTNVSAYNIFPSYAAITKIDATSFSFPLVLGGNPGTGSGGAYSPKCQFGFRVRSAVSTTFTGNSSSDMEQAAMDLYYDGNTNHYSCSMLGFFSTGPLIQPPGNMKANWHWPIQANLSQLTLLYSNLPGQVNSTLGPSVGMEYTITDGAKAGGGTALFGDALQGGGSQTIQAKYDGTVWRRSTPSAPD